MTEVALYQNFYRPSIGTSFISVGEILVIVQLNRFEIQEAWLRLNFEASKGMLTLLRVSLVL